MAESAETVTRPHLPQPATDAPDTPAYEVPPPRPDQSETIDPRLIAYVTKQQLDLAAKIAEYEPVEVTMPRDYPDGTEKPAYHAIWLRYQQGDENEAMRAFERFVEEFPGSRSAGDALHVMQSIDPARGAEIARVLADEYPGHYATPICLARYVQGALLKADLSAKHERYGLPVEGMDIDEEEWESVFNALAYLVGRYPQYFHGFEALEDLAQLLNRAPATRNAAANLFHVLVDIPNAPAKNRQAAYRGLHDLALNAGDVKQAESLAMEAAESCAGQLRFKDSRPWLLWTDPNTEFVSTPWNVVLQKGIPLRGRVLLNEPDASTPMKITCAVTREYFSVDENAWKHFPRREEPFSLILYVFPRTEDGMRPAIVVEEGYDEYLLREGGVLVSNPLQHGRTCREDLYAALPQFPVRRGKAVLPHAGGFWIAQSAHRSGDAVTVRMQMGVNQYIDQVWRDADPETGKRDPWWLRSMIVFAPEYVGPMVPTLWELHGYVHEGVERCSVERVSIEYGVEAPAEVLRKACRETGLYDLDELEVAWIDARLPALFEGEELEELRSKFNPPKTQKRTSLEEVVIGIEELLARGDAEEALKEIRESTFDLRRKGEYSLLRARAFHAAGRDTEALAVLRGMPRFGRLSEAGALQMEAELAQKHKDPIRAYLAARALVNLCPGDKAALNLLNSLEQHSDEYREAFATNPFAWYQVQAVAHSDTVHTLEAGPYTVPKAIVKEFTHRDPDYWGTVRVEIGASGDRVFYREADRIVCETNGTEVWRHVEPGRPTSEENRSPGLTFLADPQIVDREPGPVILSGVGRRNVYLGMDITYQMIDGGILMLDLQGSVVHRTDCGFCESLATGRNAQGQPFGAGVFVERGERNYYCYLVAFDLNTLEPLWKKEIKSYDRYRGRGFQDRYRVLVANSGKVDQTRIVVMSEGIRFFNLCGECVKTMEGNTRDGLIADLDGDGRQEIIARLGIPQEDARPGFSILNSFGQILLDGPEGGWLPRCARDLNGDGWAEILAAAPGTYGESGAAIGIFGVVPPE